MRVTKDNKKWEWGGQENGFQELIYSDNQRILSFIMVYRGTHEGICESRDKNLVKSNIKCWKRVTVGMNGNGVNLQILLQNDQNKMDSFMVTIQDIKEAINTVEV